jgi:hypothetical protein
MSADRRTQCGLEVLELTELSDRHPKTLERLPSSSLLGIPHSGDTRTIPSLLGQETQIGDGVGVAHAISGQAGVELEIGEGSSREWAEDAVDPTTVESETGEDPLEFSNVVTAQIGRPQHQGSIPEVPPCLEQSRPRDVVADAGFGKTPICLEI